MTRKKVDIDPFTGLPEDQIEEWMADDSGRRGYRSRLYWDIRKSSLTPDQAKELVIKASGNEICEEEYCLYIFKDFGTVGFWTQDIKMVKQMLERGLDFLYDSKSNLWFFDLYGHHQIVMHALISLYENSNKYNDNEVADQYIENCYGFFASGATGYGPPRVRMGENYKLPPEWKTMFSRLGLDIWRL